MVAIAAAKASFARLVARAESGEKVIISRHGKSVAELGPLSVAAPVGYGDLADRGIELDEDLSLPEEVIADFVFESPNADSIFDCGESFMV